MRAKRIGQCIHHGCRGTSHPVAHRRISAANHEEVSIEERVAHLAVGEKSGAVPVIGSEQGQCGRARDDLHVGSGHEELARVFRVESIAGARIHDQHAPLRISELRLRSQRVDLMAQLRARRAETRRLHQGHARRERKWRDRDEKCTRVSACERKRHFFGYSLL